MAWPFDFGLAPLFGFGLAWLGLVLARLTCRLCGPLLSLCNASTVRPDVPPLRWLNYSRWLFDPCCRYAMQRCTRRCCYVAFGSASTLALALAVVLALALALASLLAYLALLLGRPSCAVVCVALCAAMQLSLCDAGAMRLCAVATRLCLCSGFSSGSGSTAWPRYLALLLGRPLYAVFLRVRYAPAAVQLSLCDAGAMRPHAPPLCGFDSNIVGCWRGVVSAWQTYLPFRTMPHGSSLAWCWLG